ncbi:hypothetical protein C9F07_28715, partial [Salmonella enterica subsp. enterica serovar Poona]
MAFRFPQIILFLLAAMLFCPGSYAEQKPTAAQEARKTAVEVAVEGMSRAAVAGPTKISFGAVSYRHQTLPPTCRVR